MGFFTICGNHQYNRCNHMRVGGDMLMLDDIWERCPQTYIYISVIGVSLFEGFCQKSKKRK